MIVLAFDTSSRVISVALFDSDSLDGDLRGELPGDPQDGCVLARRDVEAPPAEGLLGWVDEVLAEAGVARDAIELVAVGTGPGLFTGTRVGVATAKGIAFALGRPLVGVSSLVAVLRATGANGVMLDAGRGEVYALTAGGTAFLASPEVATRTLGGRIVASASLGLGWPPAPTPDAAFIAREGLVRFTSTGRDEVATLEPDYVRPSDATLPKTPQRVSTS